jgi:hypothetical protein
MGFGINELQRIIDGQPDSPQLMNELLMLRVEYFRGKLIAFLSANESDRRIGDILQIYSRLEHEHQLRLLLSAELGDVLADWAELHPGSERDATIPRMRDVITREMAFQNIKNNEDIVELDLKTTSILSPLGDRFASFENGSWRIKATPSICDVVALDFDSDLATRHEPDSGTLSELRLELTQEEKAAVQLKLTTALENIDKAAPLYGLLIRTFLRRIIIRKSMEQDEQLGKEKEYRLGSEHRPRQPGSIRLLNTHLPQKSVAFCMEAMLHETTHTVIAAFEEMDGKFTNTYVVVRPVSAWSGNPIPNHSLAHAIFVYFICHQLFKGCLEVIDELEGVELSTIQTRLSYFGVGFLIDQRLTQCFLLDESPKDSLLAVIDQMQSTIRDMYEYSPRMEAAA